MFLPLVRHMRSISCPPNGVQLDPPHKAKEALINLVPLQGQAIIKEDLSISGMLLRAIGVVILAIWLRRELVLSPLRKL